MNSRIAVVGMSCRAPGAASYRELWRHLVAGRVLTGPWPQNRRCFSDVWRRALAEDLNLSVELGRIMAGGYLDNVSCFDAKLFGISPREAIAMDPQHRLLLETAWSALLDAGIAPRSLSGSLTGVYVGLSSMDYGLCGHEAGIHVGPYSVLGSSKSLAANRISHALDLRGPSVETDTACSSALVSISLAMQSLTTGDCDLALAGGANLILTPTVNMSFARARMLSASGQCHSFRTIADGYVRSEGVGIIALKRLGDAIEDGDPIRAVILSAAINQDGRTPGITVPSESAQMQVISRSWERAGIGPDDVDVVEAHGTGTLVGDSIELKGLAGVLKGRSANRVPCLITAVKGNIGHTEAAAGVFGVIKAVQMLESRTVPPNAGDGEEMSLPAAIRGKAAFPREQTLLPRHPSGLNRVGVSAFGFGGTNCHLILENAPLHLTQLASERGPALLTLSARKFENLCQMAGEWANELELLGDSALAAAARTSNAAFADESERLSVVADTSSAAASALRSLRNSTRERSVELSNVIGLFPATGLASGDLDLFSKETVERVRSIGMAHGSHAADVAVQALLVDIIRPVLGSLPIVVVGGEAIICEVLLGSRAVSEVLSEIEAGNVRTRGRLGDTAPPGLWRDRLDLSNRVLAIGNPATVLPAVGETVVLTPSAKELLGAIGKLWENGVPVQLNELAGKTRRIGGLPGCVFDSTCFWIESADCPGSDHSPASRGLPTTLEISMADMGHLRDHRIAGAIVAPGAALVDIALHHASREFGGAEWNAYEVQFDRPVILEETLEPPLMLTLSPRKGQKTLPEVGFQFWRLEKGHRSGPYASGMLRGD